MYQIKDVEKMKTHSLYSETFFLKSCYFGDLHKYFSCSFVIIYIYIYIYGDHINIFGVAL